MINYCMGNVGALRRNFRSVKGENVVSLDNDDVVADFLLDGHVYFVLGNIPNSNMTAIEYLAYSRALKSRLPLSNNEARRLLNEVGSHISLNKKLAKVDRVTYRRLQLAAKTTTAIKCVYVNFSGIKFSLFTKIQVAKLLKKWGKKLQVVAGFSDHRFVPKNANATVFLPDGSASGRVMQTSSPVRPSAFKRALASSNLTFKWLGKVTVIKADN